MTGPSPVPAPPSPVAVPPPVPPAVPPPVPPSVFATRWPAAGGGARPRVLAAAAIAGTIGAVALPLDRPAVGWLLTGLAVLLGTAFSAIPVAGSQLPTRVRLERLGWAAATVALLGVGTFRAAGWLFALCVLVAGVTASMALVGGRTFAGLALGTLALPVAAVRALPWAGRSAKSVRAAGGSPVRLLAAGGVGALLLIVFGALFAAADAAFARLVSSVLGDVDAGGTARAVCCFVAAGLATFGAAYLVAAPPAVDPEVDPNRIRRRLRVLEWALPVALLDALFAIFVVVQLTVLFGGHEHVLGAGGPTYAEYARGGFWQLLTVTVLTLGVIGIAVQVAPRATAWERFWLRVLLGVLAVLTLVIVASAMKRLALYESEYGFTRLRVLVGACEIWLGVLFLLVLVAGIGLRAKWLPRAALGTGVAALLVLAVLNPDRFIADHNVDRYRQTGRLDLSYLSELSPDAVPALARLPEPKRTCALLLVSAGLSRSHDTWSDFNLGRARARAALASLDESQSSYDFSRC